MTTVIPKAMQEYIMDIIFKFIQNEGKIYRKEINRLVVNIINQEKQCHHDIKSHDLYPYYKRLIEDAQPTILNPKEFINCGMYERKFKETQPEDIQRYLNGIRMCVDVSAAFGVNAQEDEVQYVLAYVNGQIALDMATLLNKLLEKYYIAPMLKSMELNDCKIYQSALASKSIIDYSRERDKFKLSLK